MYKRQSHISQTLRSELLFHEVRRRINSSVPLKIGDPIKFDSLDESMTNDELSNYLRNIKYNLNPLLDNLDIPFRNDFPEF